MEPLSNLGCATCADMRREILALQRRLGITMVYVTHDQTEAMGMADQIILLRDGRVEQVTCAAGRGLCRARHHLRHASFHRHAADEPVFPLERRETGMVLRGTGRPGRGALRGWRHDRRPAASNTFGWPRPAFPRSLAIRNILGADTVMACRAGDAEPACAAAGTCFIFPPGTPVRLALDESVHLFDTANGKRAALQGGTRRRRQRAEQC